MNAQSFPTEAQIVANWKHKDEVAVSVLCITYNHEDHIESAIRGFLIQSTDFAYEIVIHDDASSDRTASIIAEYQELYPRIIRPIYQIENQYQIARWRPLLAAFEASRGSYVALCEGDDYWTFPGKLQCQYDALEENPGIALCIHPVICERDGILDQAPSWRKHHEMLKNGRTLIVRGLQAAILPFNPDTILRQTYGQPASFFLRRAVIANIPSWIAEMATVGDRHFTYFGMKPAGCLYIDHPMSVYRVQQEGSFTKANAEYPNWVHQARNNAEILRRLALECEDDQERDSLESISSNLLFHAAVRCIEHKHLRDFRELITESYAIYPKLCPTQFCLFHARHFANWLALPMRMKSAHSFSVYR